MKEKTIKDLKNVEIVRVLDFGFYNGCIVEVKNLNDVLGCGYMYKRIKKKNGE